MPHGLRRFQRAEALHFITFSCFHRLPYLASTGAKDVAEAILEEVRARHQARIYAYVLMPEHVHLLVNEPPVILLAQFVKVFKQAVSRELKGTREQFWLPRYFDANIDGEKERAEVVQYIHRNPVKRGLVSRPEDYRWSSYLHYASGERGVVEIESERTARLRGFVPWSKADVICGLIPLIAQKTRDEWGTDRWRVSMSGPRGRRFVA